MLRTTVITSDDPDAEEAARELVEAIHRTGAGQGTCAGVLFITDFMEPAPIVEALSENFPELKLIGCSTEGNLCSVGGYSLDSAVMMLWRAGDTPIRAVVCRDLSHGVEQSVAHALEGALAEGEEVAFCITLPESLSVGGDAVVAALRGAVRADLPIFGGLSADKWSFDATFQIFNGEVLRDAAPVLLFIQSPTLRYSFGVSSGWFPLGNAGEVTRAAGNRVEEINQRPAVEFYRKYFGDDFEIGGEFPLKVEGPDGPFLRAPLSHDNDQGWILFAGDVPVGAKVWITTAERDGILDACDAAVEQALEQFDGRPEAALVTSCAARHYVLANQVDEELKRVVGKLGSELPVAGFYAFGEFCPGERDRGTSMHNETFTILLVGEAADP